MQNQTTRTNKRITMGYHDITPEHLQRLHELADLQHPHLKGDNHTRKLIDKVYNREQLTISEALLDGVGSTAVTTVVIVNPYTFNSKKRKGPFGPQ